jgi:hypothetical protein
VRQGREGRQGRVNWRNLPCGQLEFNLARACWELGWNTHLQVTWPKGTSMCLATPSV